MRLARTAAIGAAALTAVAVSAAPAGAATNDPLYAKQYGPQQIHAEQAWATSTGAGAVIAVIDSGVDLGHADLAGKLVAGATFIGCYLLLWQRRLEGPGRSRSAGGRPRHARLRYRRRGDRTTASASPA